MSRLIYINVKGSTRTTVEAAAIESQPVNERQQANIDYYLKRQEYLRAVRLTYSTARMLAATDADEAHPLRTNEETAKVFEYLGRLVREQATDPPS
jgi:hypothetical protein